MKQDVTPNSVHFYDVTAGKIVCGISLVPERTVFPQATTCPACLEQLRADQILSVSKKYRTQETTNEKPLKPAV